MIGQTSGSPDRAQTTQGGSRRSRADRPEARRVDLPRRAGAALRRALRAVPHEAFAPSGAVTAAAAGEGAAQDREVCAAPSAALLAALDHLDVECGQSVLEVGSGSGLCAALLAEMVGPEGHVVTLEIDPHRAADARLNLVRAGYPDVDVIASDGTYGFAAGAPYDRVLVRGATRLLPRQWAEQLRPNGRLVLPLEIRGWQFLAALERGGGELRSRWLAPADFAPLRGGPAVRDGGSEVRAGAWLARFDGFEGEVRTLRRILACPPVPQPDATAAVPDAGWEFVWYLLLHDRRALLVRPDGGRGTEGQPGAAVPWGVGLLDAEVGSLAVVLPAEAGEDRPRVVTFGRDDVLAALLHHRDIWRTMGPTKPALVAVPAASAAGAPRALREPYGLAAVWEVD